MPFLKKIGYREHRGRLIGFGNNEGVMCEDDEWSCGGGLRYREWFTEWERR
jgi:hypothetical protein